MSNELYKKPKKNNKPTLNEIAEEWGPSYDSDEDLDKETQEKIKDTRFKSEQDQYRREGWEKSPLFPKIKRSVKSVIYGDKRAPKPKKPE